MEVQSLNNEQTIQEYRKLGTPQSVFNKIKTECKTLDDIFKSPHQTIGYLGSLSENWQKFVLSYIAIAIVDYLEFVGREYTINDKQVIEMAMNDKQVTETAILILEQKAQLKMDDIWGITRMLISDSLLMTLKIHQIKT